MKSLKQREEKAALATQVIDSFFGEYRWLSNFYPSLIWMDGLHYPFVENAYQAAKTNDYKLKKQFQMLSPKEAKKLGNYVELRSDWEDVKYSIMEYCCYQKFQDPVLKSWLLSTGDAELIEGNYWNDTYWGICKGVGQNNLGKILMKVRGELIAG